MNRVSQKIFKTFENCFNGPEDKIYLDKNGKIEHASISSFKRVSTIVQNVLKATIVSFALPVAFMGYFLDKTINVFSSDKKPFDEIPDVAIDDIVDALPKDIGFADSLFQSCGLGTKYSKPDFVGRSNWNESMTKEHMEVESEEEFDNFFVNYLDDPKTLIKILKDAGATSYRFSLERSVIEPEKGRYDFDAIHKYQNFCKELKNSGIEPWITLEHFVEPMWFTEDGGFEKEENIEDFVRYSEFIIPLFKDYVTNWMTFNEVGAYVFQSYIRKVYPTAANKTKQNSIYLAAKVLRNILIAHIKIYQNIKKKYPELQIGIVHQWLKMKPFNPNNPIEELVCYYISQITHNFTYNFFKTNKFEFKVPLSANIHLEIDKDQKITDFIGFQCYGYPKIKIGFNGGKKYPGYQVKNYTIPKLKLGATFGSTCKEGGKMQSFGMLFNPESICDALEEASELNIPIAITETGCDSRVQNWGDKDFKVDDQTQKKYFEKIFSLIAKFKEKLPLKGLFFWTILRGHLEWERAGTVSLGLVKVDKDKDGKIKSHELTPAAKYIQSIFEKAHARDYSSKEEKIA
ncbi:MAG: Beta-glucosidase A [Candidatus Anoxychlamydiales bacterium]|nr:Beta-glucosidase A [Candidatus Anoxychlamydiales bacterium]